MIINKLFWQKYRPKSVDGMILLPRIEKLLLKDGDFIISGNLLFAGSSSGTGKSSMANLLAGKHAKKINASYNSSVEDLKDDVTDFCRMVSDSIFDDDYDPNKPQMKFVYLDEFDGVSAKYQEALRGFIEDNSDRVRFIATCNNLSKISPAMQSRFNVINFDPQTMEEQRWLKEQYLERLELICEKEKIDLDAQELNAIINTSFPDLRAAISRLQVIKDAGKTAKIKDNLYEEFYKFIFGKSDPAATYEWVMNNFGDKVEGALKMCGRPLSEYITQYKPEHINKLPKLVPKVNEYCNDLQIAMDPVCHVLACVYVIQEIINTKQN
jgi:DNA polymerase III delta prime subunit